MRTLKQTIAVALLLSMLFALASCGGSKTAFKMGDYQFTVRYSRGEDHYDYKSVSVTLNFGDAGIPQSLFEEYLEDGKVMLDGKEPGKAYLYKQNSNGLITSADITFHMPVGYQFDESKLTVTE